MSGCEPEGWINVSTGNFWHTRLNQIYTLLKSLEADGEVVSHIEPQEDRADLRRWLAEPITEHEVKKGRLTGEGVLPLAGGQNRPAHPTAPAIEPAPAEAGRVPAADAGRDSGNVRPAADPAAGRHAVGGEQDEAMYMRWLEATIALVERDFPDR
jgi:hypothetical protein